jgi:hypothetical protein
MDLLKRIAGLFSAPAARASQGNFYVVHVKCSRCGEVVEGRINLNNDLSYEDDETGEGAATTLTCRKVLVGGAQRCFQTMEVVLRFDAGRRLLEKKVTGGVFVE